MSVETPKAPLKPIRAAFVPKDTLCHDCHKKAGRIRRRVYIFAKCPVTGLSVPVKIHPRPTLYAYCKCGRRWKRRIPRNEIVLSSD